MDTKLYSTKEVAKLLGVGLSCLSRAVYEDRIDPPQKGPGGAFLWGVRDIERASWALRRKSVDDIFSEASSEQGGQKREGSNTKCI